jgi:hypothetical protein
MRLPEVTLRLPGWVDDLLDLLEEPDRVSAGVEERMQLAIELSRSSVRHGVSGPFGAAIFIRKMNKLLAPGVNLALASGCSVAYAEMVAIMIAPAAHRGLRSRWRGAATLRAGNQYGAVLYVPRRVPCSGVFRTWCAAPETRTPQRSASTKDRNQAAGLGS